MEKPNHKFIFDSGPFIELKSYPKDVFVTLWGNLEHLIGRGKIISSSEVLREIGNYEDEIGAWAKANKIIFERPTEPEQYLVSEMLSKYPDMVKKKNILSGKADADPFVIAKAHELGCYLVSTEKFKPNAQKIPNICEKYGVSHLSWFEFLRLMEWKF